MPEIEFTIGTGGQLTCTSRASPRSAWRTSRALLKILGHPAEGQATSEYHLRPRIQPRTRAGPSPVSELTWIIDSASGQITVEGLGETRAVSHRRPASRPGVSVNCARPRTSGLRSSEQQPARSADSSDLSWARRRRSGRRSVVQFGAAPFAARALSSVWR